MVEPLATLRRPVNWCGFSVTSKFQQTVFCALILLVLMLLWFDVEKISTAFDETSVNSYISETELHESDASWGKHRGCFILAEHNSNTKHNQLWSQCLLHCALAGFYFSALNQMKCECLEPDTVAKAVAIDDDECNHECSYSPGKSCGGPYGVVNVYRTMAKMSCEKIRIGNKDEFAKIMLSSFPGSGNTWVRYLLDRMLGVFSGSLTFDKSLFRGGFTGEDNDFDDRRSIITKSHRFVPDIEGAVLLIRNPYDALLAEFNRMGQGHTGHATRSAFHTRKWIDHVVHGASRWAKIYEKFIRACPVHILYFEQVKDNLEMALRPVGTFINNVNDQRRNNTRSETEDLDKRLECVVADSEGNFHRTRKTDTFDPFIVDDELIVVTNHFINMLNKTLIEFDLPPLPSDYLR